MSSWQLLWLCVIWTTVSHIQAGRTKRDESHSSAQSAPWNTHGINEGHLQGWSNHHNYPVPNRSSTGTTDNDSDESDTGSRTALSGRAQSYPSQPSVGFNQWGAAVHRKQSVNQGRALSGSYVPGGNKPSAENTDSDSHETVSSQSVDQSVQWKVPATGLPGNAAPDNKVLEGDSDEDSVESSPSVPDKSQGVSQNKWTVTAPKVAASVKRTVVFNTQSTGNTETDSTDSSSSESRQPRPIVRAPARKLPVPKIGLAASGFVPKSTEKPSTENPSEEDNDSESKESREKGPLIPQQPVPIPAPVPGRTRPVLPPRFVPVVRSRPRTKVGVPKTKVPILDLRPRRPIPRRPVIPPVPRRPVIPSMPRRPVAPMPRRPVVPMPRRPVVPMPRRPVVPKPRRPLFVRKPRPPSVVGRPRLPATPRTSSRRFPTVIQQKKVAVAQPWWQSMTPRRRVPVVSNRAPTAPRKVPQPKPAPVPMPIRPAMPIVPAVANRGQSKDSSSKSSEEVAQPDSVEEDSDFKSAEVPRPTPVISPATTKKLATPPPPVVTRPQPVTPKRPSVSVWWPVIPKQPQTPRPFTKAPSTAKPSTKASLPDPQASNESDLSTEDDDSKEDKTTTTRATDTAQRQYPSMRQPHPAPRPDPQPATSSDSQGDSGGTDSTGQHPQDPGYPYSSHSGEDSHESQEDDSIEDGYVYYHPPPRPVCPVIADVIVMIDGSDSLTEQNFNAGKQVTDQIIAKMHLHPEDGYVVGVLVFSDAIQEIRLRPFKDNVYLRTLVMNTYQEMGGTGTDYALYNMRRLFFAEGRSGVPKIGIVMTDGRARNPSSAIEQARMAKMEGITLISVALGVVTNPKELSAIASSPRHVVINPSANAILRLIQAYSSTRCPDPARPPQPVHPPQPVYPPHPVHPPQHPVHPSLPVHPPHPTHRPGPVYPPKYPTQPTPRPGYPTVATQPPVYPPRFTYTPHPPVYSPVTQPPVYPTPTQRPRPKGPCDDCTFLNGIGYNPHESECSYYYQCFDNNGVLVPVQRECALGLFWHQGDLTCRRAASVDCVNDPCKRSPRPYGTPKNCRGYWKCLWGRTVSAECCPYSHRFDGRRRDCVYDNRCTVQCPPGQPTQPAVCNKQPYPLDRTQYYEDIGQGRTILRRCAPGSAFVADPICRCNQTIGVDPIPWQCKPDLYFPFDDDLEDRSDSRAPVYIEGVTIDRTPTSGAIGRGAALFQGDGRILVWSYANRELGSKFVVRLRYKALPAANVSQDEGLITNSDCKLPCSVAVSFNRTDNTTTAKIRTEYTNVVRSLLPHSSDWNQVEYRYDGTRLSFSVNGNSQSLSARGNIVKVPAALQIGTGCMGYAPFTGLIDELYVYNCIP